MSSWSIRVCREKSVVCNGACRRDLARVSASNESKQYHHLSHLRMSTSALDRYCRIRRQKLVTPGEPPTSEPDRPKPTGVSGADESQETCDDLRVEKLPNPSTNLALKRRRVAPSMANRSEWPHRHEGRAPLNAPLRTSCRDFPASSLVSKVNCGKPWPSLKL